MLIEIPGEDIIAYGRSIGSGPSVHLAVKRRIAALILQCPLASIIRVKLPFIPFTLPGDLFCNIDKVSNVHVPTLILHGTKDNIVPIQASKLLLERLSEGYYVWIEGGTHNDLDLYYIQEMESALSEFFNITVQRRYEAPLQIGYTGNALKRLNKPCKLRVSSRRVSGCNNVAAHNCF